MGSHIWCCMGWRFKCKYVCIVAIPEIRTSAGVSYGERDHSLTHTARTPELRTSASVFEVYPTMIYHRRIKSIARTQDVGTTGSVRDLSGDGLSSKDKRNTENKQYIILLLKIIYRHLLHFIAMICLCIFAIFNNTRVFI